MEGSPQSPTSGEIAGQVKKKSGERLPKNRRGLDGEVVHC